MGTGEAKKYIFFYLDILGIERIVRVDEFTLFRALKKVPYKKVMRVTKATSNEKPIPQNYLFKNLGRVERWHENLKRIEL